MAKPHFTGKDMFLLEDGSTYHVGVKADIVRPRVLTVGSKKRAELLAEALLSPVEATVHSSRDFNLYSGKYRGTPVSIVSIGMGVSSMDFLVRELSFVCSEPMAIIRFGTCGIFDPSLEPGTIVTCGKGSHYVCTNYSHYYGSADGTVKPGEGSTHTLCGVVPCTPELNACLVECLKEAKLKSVDGLNASAETFYTCQGRQLEEFTDRQVGFAERMVKLGVSSVEMETHQLFHLAKQRKKPCYVAAAAVGIVNRVADYPNVDDSELRRLELEGGRCCLEALVRFQL